MARGVVREGSKTNFYELQCQFGFLECQQPVRDLLRVPESARDNVEKIFGDERKNVALSFAVGRYNPSILSTNSNLSIRKLSTSNRVAISCNRKQQCMYRKMQVQKEQCAMLCPLPLRRAWLWKPISTRCASGNCDGRTSRACRWGNWREFKFSCR